MGYDESGQLTEKIRRHPYSVVLFDEIEKAHPDVFNLMLQILDEGHLTDAKGRKVNFKNAIIVMTSNIGSDIILESGTRSKIGFDNGHTQAHSKTSRDDEELEEKIMHLMKDQFRPEFLNRVDETIIFHSLGKDQIRLIVEKQIERVADRLKLQSIGLEVTKKAKDLLAELGYDPQFGARPLKRVIQDRLLNPISMLIITQSLKDDSTLVVDAKDKELTVKVR